MDYFDWACSEITDLNSDIEHYREQISSLEEELREAQETIQEHEDQDARVRELEHELFELQLEIDDMSEPIDGDWAELVEWADEYKRAEALDLEPPSLDALLDKIYAVYGSG